MNLIHWCSPKWLPWWFVEHALAGSPLAWLSQFKGKNLFCDLNRNATASGLLFWLVKQSVTAEHDMTASQTKTSAAVLRHLRCSLFISQARIHGYHYVWSFTLWILASVVIGGLRDYFSPRLLRLILFFHYNINTDLWSIAHDHRRHACLLYVFASLHPYSPYVVMPFHPSGQSNNHVRRGSIHLHITIQEHVKILSHVHSDWLLSWVKCVLITANDWLSSFLSFQQFICNS